jgi:valyl-tRNA synthetase
VHRLFAPFLPFVSDEVWSWWRTGSVHVAAWPDAAGLTALAGGSSADVYEEATRVLGEVRKAKTEAKASLRAPVERVAVHGPSARLALVGAARADLAEAGSVADFALVEGGEDLRVEVVLAAG